MYQIHWTIGGEWLKYYHKRNLMHCNPSKTHQWGNPDKIANLQNNSKRWIDGTDNLLDTITSQENL